MNTHIGTTMITRAMAVLDAVVPQDLDLIQRENEMVDFWIEQTFQGQSQSARNHLRDQWYSKDSQFDDFYLNLDDTNQRAVLESFNIQVEPDKYPTSLERDTALINGASPWDCHPFETYAVFLFLRFAYNNSLIAIEKLPGGAERLRDSGVKRFGNGGNWGEFYESLRTSRDETFRAAFVEMMVSPAGQHYTDY